MNKVAMDVGYNIYDGSTTARVSISCITVRWQRNTLNFGLSINILFLFHRDRAHLLGPKRLREPARRTNSLDFLQATGSS